MTPQYADPEELRRRALLAPMGLGQDENYSQQAPEEQPPDISGVMGADETEQQDETTPPGTPSTSGTLKLSPAQQHYQDVLNQAPNRANYQPSTLRKVLAAMAGAGAAADGHDPVAAAEGMRSVPFNRAMQPWDQQRQIAAQGMSIEEKAHADQIATTRAAAMTQNAQARMRAAAATETWRQAQALKPQPYVATTKDDALDMINAAHPRTEKPVTPFQVWLQQHPDGDPTEYNKSLRNPSAAMTFQQRRQLQSEGISQRETAIDARTKKAAVAKPASPADQQKATIQAAQELARINPEYAGFIVSNEKNKAGNLLPARIKTTEEIADKGGFLGMGGRSDTQISLARESYRKFLSEIGQRKRAILGSKAPTGGWNIEENEDDEEDDQ